jgi:hypothetical protein
MTDRIALGHATVTRVVETTMEMRTSLFDGTDADAWAAHADLVEPDFWNRGAERWCIAMQTWVVEVDGLTVVVDSGVGNVG